MRTLTDWVGHTPPPQGSTRLNMSSFSINSCTENSGIINQSPCWLKPPQPSKINSVDFNLRTWDVTHKERLSSQAKCWFPIFLWNECVFTLLPSPHLMNESTQADWISDFGTRQCTHPMPGIEHRPDLKHQALPTWGHHPTGSSTHFLIQAYETPCTSFGCLWKCTSQKSNIPQAIVAPNSKTQHFHHIDPFHGCSSDVRYLAWFCILPKNRYWRPQATRILNLPHFQTYKVTYWCLDLAWSTYPS